MKTGFIVFPGDKNGNIGQKWVKNIWNIFLFQKFFESRVRTRLTNKQSMFPSSRNHSIDFTGCYMKETLIISGLMGHWLKQ